MLVTIEVVLLVVLAVLTIGIDVYLNFVPPEANTFSALARAWARLNPFWPWAWGILAGRFFHWGMEPVLDDPYGIVVIVTSTAVVTILFAVLQIWCVWSAIRSNVGIPLAFVLGYVAGSLFWPVNVADIQFAT